MVAWSRGGELEGRARSRLGDARILRATAPGKTAVSRGAPWELDRLIRKFQPHLLHVALTRPALLGVPVAALCRVPRVVIAQHGVHEWREGRAMPEWLVRTAFVNVARFADRVVAVSAAGARALADAGVSPGKLLAIPNGVDTDRFSPALRANRGDILGNLFGLALPAETILVGGAGNLRAVKGYDVFVEAAARIAAFTPDVRFVVWGEGSERGALEGLIRERGLGDRFLLPGRTSSPEISLAACDVFVQPSREEAFGLAAAEAMSCGVPVIASAAGGLSELVEDGVSGLLVTPGDIGSLAANLGYLLRNPDLRAGMGTRARERICAQFQVQRMVRDFLILYDLLLHD